MAQAISTRNDTRRVLVLVNGTVDGPTLREAIGTAPESAAVRLVAPALDTSRRRRVARDSARQSAERSLELCLAALAESGITAGGAVGDPEPLRAIQDSLRAFAADEIVIASDAPGRAPAGLALEAMGRFGLPVAELAARRPRRQAMTLEAA